MAKKKFLSTTKRPAAQVVLAKKAITTKVANERKRQQPAWLQRPMPALQNDPPPALEWLSDANQSQGPPRLLSKAEVCAIANVSFPTIWSWMRAGTFPRSRVVGGKSAWLSTEVENWLANLPRRALKGDAPIAGVA